MSIRTWHPALGLYFAVGIGGLALYLANSENAEAAALLLITMVVITLPIGLLVAAVLAISARLFDQTGLTGSFGVFGQVVLWAIFLGVGFVQWKYIAPWVIRRLQTHARP